MATLKELVIKIKAQTDGLQQGLKKATEGIAGFGRRVTVIAKKVTRDFERMAVKFAESRIGAAALGFGIFQLTNTLSQLPGLVVSNAESFNQLNGRLRDSVGSVQAADAVMQQLVASSNRTGQSLEATIQGFVRLQPAAARLGKTNTELVRFLETFQKMGAVAGAVGPEMKNAMIQLSQGIASGTLRGDELRSVLEQMPKLAEDIADKMGIPFEEFRKAAQEGRVTAQEVFNAVIAKSDEVDASFSKLPPSVTRSLNEIQNGLFLLGGELNTTTGLTDTLAGAMSGAAGQISNATQFVINHRSELQQLGSVVAALITGAAFAGGILGLASIFSRLPAIIASVSTAVVVLRTALLSLAGPVGILVAAITAIGSLVAFDLARPRTEAEKALKLKERAIKLQKEAQNLSAGNDQGRFFNPLQRQKRLDEIKKESIEIKKQSQLILEQNKAVAAATQLQTNLGKAISGGSASAGGGGGGGRGHATPRSQKVAHVTEKIKELGQVVEDTLPKVDNRIDASLEAVQKATKESMQVRGLSDPTGEIGGQLKWLEDLQNTENTLMQIRDLSPDAKAQLEEVNQSGQNMQQAFSGYLNDIGRKFEDTFIESIKSGKLNFKDFAVSILEDLGRLMLRLLVIQPIIDRFTNALSGKASGTGGKSGVFSSLFSGFGKAVGSIFGGKSVPGKATGGDIMGGRPYLVGERGPELIFPSKSGRVMNNQGTRQTLGGQEIQPIIINQNFQVGVAQTVKAEMMNMEPRIVANTLKALDRDVRRNGSMAKTVGRRS